MRRNLPQVKKPELASAVRQAAFTLFSQDGYNATSMAAIARQAGTAVSNLYAYWPGKLDLLYDIYRPWLQAQLATLEQEVGRQPTPRARLLRLFTGIWADIPAADNAFANTLIEALSAAPRQTPKPNALLPWAEQWLTALLVKCLPLGPKAAQASLAHVTWMAFDGYALNRRIGDVRDVKIMANHMVDLLLHG